MTSDEFEKSMSKIAGDISQPAGDATKRARDYAATTADHAASVAGGTTEAAGDLYTQAKSGLDDALNSAGPSAGDAWAKGQAAAERGGDQIAGQVRKQPIEALLLAAAVGYLLGWASSR